jgi:hypothetical protein
MSEQSRIHSVSSTLGAQDNNRLPREIRQVWETIAPGLADLLAGALDAIDDSLFELANGARSNNDQNRYFETMREVRIKRKGIEKQFQEGLANLFRHPPASDITRRHEKPRQSVNADNLSLVDNDDLEEQVAISAMTNKAAVTFQGTLLPLQTRLTSLYHGHSSDSPVNPLAPEPLSNLFREACSDLDIQIRERLILLKHFDRYVLASLGLVLDEANRILIQAGVVPNFHYKAHKSEQVSDSQARRNREKESAADAASGKEFLESIGALLAGYRRHSPDTFGGSAESDSFYIVSKKELYDLLSQMPQPIAESDLTQRRPDLREMISDLLARQPTTEDRMPALQSMDEDLINLVALLFEFVLDDHNLSPPIQVLISRLQIPILKVVVKDHSFFSKPSHPARKLLNALARAGIGWSNHGEKNRDRLYDEIHRVVHRILEDFNGEITLFETLYDEFEEFLGRENRKASLVEQRTRESERGRIKSRKAQETVDQVLKERLKNRHVPDSVRELLVHGWSRVMFLAYLRDDAEHRWAQTVRVVDDLLWCLRPQPQSQNREQWVRLVPTLLKSVRAGLEEVSYNANRLDGMMAELKKELTDSFRRQALAEAAEDSLNPEIPDEVPPATTTTAVEWEQALEDAVMAEHYETLEGVQVGDWVEFRLVNGTCFRCRLSAVIEEADSFVFVNRMGLKVVEKSRNELAHELRRERLMVLEQGALVDRALDAVVGGLTRKAG